MRLLRIVKSSALQTPTVWIKNVDAGGGNSCPVKRSGRIALVVVRFQKSHNVIMINDFAFLDLISAERKGAEHGKLIPSLLITNRVWHSCLNFTVYRDGDWLMHFERLFDHVAVFVFKYMPLSINWQTDDGII